VQWSGACDAPVGPVGVVVLRELAQGVEQMVLVPDQGAVQQLVPTGLYPACSLTRLPLFISADQSACLSSKQTPGSNPGRIRPRVLFAPPQWQMDKRDISGVQWVREGRKPTDTRTGSGGQPPKVSSDVSPAGHTRALEARTSSLGAPDGNSDKCPSHGCPGHGYAFRPSARRTT
jgi:hypothetical protein